MDSSRTKFSTIFAFGFVFFISALSGLLMLPIFSGLDDIQFFIIIFLSNPSIYPLILIVLLISGFILGEVFYSFLPLYRTIKYKKLILFVIVIMISVFIAFQNRINTHPNYYYYSENDCKNIVKKWNTSKYLSKEYCFHEVATRTNDPLVCNNLGLGEETMGTYTKIFCLEQVARNTNDPSICELIPDSHRQYCYYQMRVCEKLTGESLKLQCLGNRAYIESI